MKITAKTYYMASDKEGHVYDIEFVPVTAPPFKFKVIIRQGTNVFAKDWSTKKNKTCALYFAEKHINPAN